MLRNVFTKVFGTRHERERRRVQPIVDAINEQGERLAEMPEAELRGIVRESIAETGASSPKDLGQVMKATMAKVGTRADGKRVSALAREELGA